MKPEKQHLTHLLIPAILFVGIIAGDMGVFSWQNLLVQRTYVVEVVMALCVVFIYQGTVRSEWIKNRTLSQKLIFLGIAVILLTSVLRMVNTKTPDVWRGPTGPSVVIPSAVFNNVAVAITYAAVVLWAILLLVTLRELIFVQQSKKTAAQFRILLFFIAAHVVYILIRGKDTGFTTIHVFNTRSFNLTNNFCLLIMGLQAFIIGFRCKWIHYLNRGQKVGFFFFFVAIAPVCFFLSQEVGGGFLNYSVVVGGFLECLTILYIVYSFMAIIGILLLLPSAGLLDRKMREIHSLQTLSATIRSVFDRRELINKTTDLALKVVDADFSWLELRDDNRYKLEGAHNIKPEAVERLPDDIRKVFRRELKKTDGALLIHDLLKNRETRAIRKWGRRAGSLLAAQIRFKKKELGILYALHREPFGFVEESRALFQAFADQVAAALENTNLIQLTIDQQVYHEELRLAHEAQMRLLPQTMPDIEGIEIDAYCATANEIGGDFYDLIPVGENRIDIVVGDVSGKGASAAFYMAELKGVTQALAPHFSSPKKLLVEVNDFLQNHFEANTFVTMVYCILLLDKKQIRLVRAGHPPVGLVRKNNVQWIETKGIGLGLASNEVFRKALEEKSISLKKEDTIFCYTDGLSEARNSAGEDYGEEVLTQTLLDLHGSTAEEILSEIRGRLENFTKGESRHDDVTLVTLRMLK